MKGRSWWRRLLGACDMLDHAGKPQFSKLMIAAVLVVTATRHTLTTAVAIALLAAAFGRSVFVAFLCRAQIGVTDATQRATLAVDPETAKAIAERRRLGGGDYEAAP